ncbi:hypothetical protein [Candidatus Methanodesulfokora washburnensis]|uniref:Uncharacterized protein n=1 Tax=Candidatus Methanodesulfokora washburnensis TaxID=2478471 RepID=A0A3R9PZT5_9CREN|nr:hypothetical protein [Candidatus Methanodesulfokores washburnensis]RSN77471.1 hypothetical protein D6D85_02550 [Candidatus Methanodesulfokores washburnensis]
MEWWEVLKFDWVSKSWRNTYICLLLLTILVVFLYLIIYPSFYWQHLYGLVVYILFCVAVLIYISQGIYFIFRNKVRSGDKVEQWRRLYGDVIGAVALILGFSFILIFSNGKIRERALWDLAFSLVGVVLSSAIFALPSLFSKRSKRASSVKA